MVFAKGTAGVYEIEPSMRWNPAVVAGVGMIRDPRPLYNDMHAYLAASGAPANAVSEFLDEDYLYLMLHIQAGLLWGRGTHLPDGCAESERSAHYISRAGM